MATTKTPRTAKNSQGKYRRINSHGISINAGPSYLARLDEVCKKTKRTRASLLEYALYRVCLDEYQVDLGERYGDNDQADPTAE